MKLYLVRHAQSLRNARIASDIDANLTEIGQEQAKRLGSYIKDIKFHKIYCSPLKRTRKTLEKIQPFVEKTPMAFSKKMIEFNMGIFGKGGIDDWSSFFKAAENEGVPSHLFKPKNGESLQGCYHRAGKFYRELLKKHPKQNILLVGHGLFFLHLILNSLNLSVTEGKYYTLSNASISILETSPKGKVTHFTFNDLSHLIKEGIKLKEGR
ncbi:MAG: histidine phosphatase family protein [Nanoarchaeota archaeon]|nr:histidine phosphatase family protein [Nanoarchaeota archaeon]MBU1051231.1 histidine phosphatase family protein [Nanoarchaeota archaeon]MBU1988541.1 histidine phosphatase family protein [Nanoarchaeota archaeon]